MACLSRRMLTCLLGFPFGSEFGFQRGERGWRAGAQVWSARAHPFPLLIPPPYPDCFVWRLSHRRRTRTRFRHASHRCLSVARVVASSWSKKAATAARSVGSRATARATARTRRAAGRRSSVVGGAARRRAAARRENGSAVDAAAALVAHAEGREGFLNAMTAELSRAPSSRQKEGSRRSAVCARP